MAAKKMIDLLSLSVKDLLPGHLSQGDDVGILLEIMDEEIHYLNEIVSKMAVPDDLMDLPDEAIEHLLWENHIYPKEGAALAISKAEKVELVKGSRELHQLKGTKRAIEKIFAILNLDANLEEWFEYSGDPYYFRLDVEVSRKGLTESQFLWLEDLLREYKNARSWVERIRLHLNADTKLHLASNFSGGERLTMYPKIKHKAEQKKPMYLAAAFREGESVLVRPALKTRMEQHHEMAITATVTSGEEIKVKPYELKNMDLEQFSNFATGIFCAEQTTVYPIIQEVLRDVKESFIGTQIYSAEKIAAYPL